eukprot:6583086-Prymnesium_polylepis.1
MRRSCWAAARRVVGCATSRWAGRWRSCGAAGRGPRTFSAITHTRISDTWEAGLGWYGLSPMVRREAVSGATRALRC